MCICCQRILAMHLNSEGFSASLPQIRGGNAFQIFDRSARARQSLAFNVQWSIQPAQLSRPDDILALFKLDGAAPRQVGHTRVRCACTHLHIPESG